MSVCCPPAVCEGTKPRLGGVRNAHALVVLSDKTLPVAAWVAACLPVVCVCLHLQPSLTMLGAVGRCCSGALQAFKPGINSLKTISARHAALNLSKCILFKHGWTGSIGRQCGHHDWSVVQMHAS